MNSSAAVPHAAGTAVYHLLKKVSVMPFVRGFFGSPSSGGWSHSVNLANARVASVELFVTNSLGNSKTSTLAVSQTTDFGLRTLSGGQLSLQVEGYLAIRANATPDLIVEAPHSVRDVYAVVRQPSTDLPIRIELKQDGEPYCTLTISPGALVSNAIDGFGLAPLQEGSKLSVDLTSVGQANPGSDLTIILRL